MATLPVVGSNNVLPFRTLISVPDPVYVTPLLPFAAAVFVVDKVCASLVTTTVYESAPDFTP